jgi:hypothetical protein
MTILLNNVYVALEQGIINRSSLYLIYTHREITYPIKVKNCFSLQLKYIVEINETDAREKR